MISQIKAKMSEMNGEMALVVHGKNHGRNSKRKDRLSLRKHMLLVNDYVFGLIMEHLRKLNGVGWGAILEMRLVCKVWSTKILDLPRWVWRSYKQYNKYCNLVQQLSCENHVKFLKRMQSDPVLKALDIDFSRKVSLKIVKTLRLKKLLNYKKIGKNRADFYLSLKEKCSQCHDNGQGSAKRCFHCPHALHQRIVKKQMTKKQIAATMIKPRVYKKDIPSSVSLSNKIRFFNNFQQRNQ